MLQVLLSVHGNAATATKLATARKITLKGATRGSANFDGSGDIEITTDEIKAVTDRLYSRVYTNNSDLIASITALHSKVIHDALNEVDETGTQCQFYMMILDSLFADEVRYLISLLPSSNSYKSLLTNWINNYTLSSTEKTEYGSAFFARKLALLTGAGSTDNPATLVIENTNYSLPNLISKLRATL